MESNGTGPERCGAAPTTCGLEAPLLALEERGAGSAPESLRYLREIARIPLLSRAEQAGLAAALRESTTRFRERILSTPAAAALVVGRWREIRDAGRVTGTLSAGYRDGTGRDYSPDVDAGLARAEQALERRAGRVRGRAPAARGRAALDAEIRAALEEANLSTDVVTSLFDGLRGLADAIAGARGPQRAALLERTGESAEGFARRVREARDALRAMLELKNRFVQHNLRLVVSVAREFRNMGVEFVDLIQEANVGLIRAVEKFDERRGFTFSTYAVWWLRQACVRAVQQQSRSVRLPSNIYDLILQHRRARASLQRSLGREPDAWELAEELEIDVETVDLVARWSRREASTEDPLPHGDSLRLGDVLADEDATSPLNPIDRDEIRRELPQLLDGLTPRERSIVEAYYGLADGDGATLEQIGSRLGLSRERVRQIKAGALEKLSKRAAARGLEASLIPADRSLELR